MWRRTLASTLTILTLVACRAGPSPTPVASSPAPSAPTPTAPADAHLNASLTVNGHDLWVECRGSGKPVIVLEAGFGGDNDAWGAIVPQLDAETRVCAYDRLGNGFSDRPTGARTVQDVVDDLNALLTAADVVPPIVLVGHSFGGLTSVAYTAQHPDDVAALVLIDAGHPDTFDRFRAVLSEDEREEYDRSIRADNREHIALEATALEVRPWLQDFPDVPLTVIGAVRHASANCVLPYTPETCAAVDAANLALQRDYATLTADARFIEADTGHFVVQDDPDLVVDEVLHALEQAKR